MYKIGAHFNQYYGHLSQKVSEDQKKNKNKGLLLQIGADFGQKYGSLSQKVGKDQKKKKKRRSLPQIQTDFGKTEQKKVLVWTFLFARKC